jgi:hypothetical protein
MTIASMADPSSQQATTKFPSVLQYVVQFFRFESGQCTIPESGAGAASQVLLGANDI